MKRSVALLALLSVSILFFGCAENPNFAANLSVQENDQEPKADHDEPEPAPHDAPPTITPTVTPTPTPTPTPPPVAPYVTLPDHVVQDLASMNDYAIQIQGGSAPATFQLTLARDALDVVLDAFPGEKANLKLAYSEPTVTVAANQSKTVFLRAQVVGTTMPALNQGAKIKLTATSGAMVVNKEIPIILQPIVHMELRSDDKYYLNNAAITKVRIRKLYPTLTDLHASTLLVQVPNDYDDLIGIDGAVVRQSFGPFMSGGQRFFQAFVKLNSSLGLGFVDNVLAATPIRLEVEHIP